MTSYFEIGGHLVECSTEDSTSLPSSKFGGIAAERPERGRNSAKAEEATTRVDQSLSGYGTPRTYRNFALRMVANHMIRTGVIILMVPDPIPVVDEVLGAGLVYGGLYIHSTVE